MPQLITEDKRVRLLIDTTSILNRDGRLVVESKVGGKVILRGELGRAGMPTSNNRIYPEEVLKREIGRLQKEASERRLYGELDHPCLQSSDFRVLTLSGWKQFSDIKAGDKVWSRKDGKAVESVVEGIVNEPYDGPVYHVKGRSIDSTFTPGHRMLLLRRPDMNDLSEMYRTVEDVSINMNSLRHSCIPKCAEWTSGSSEWVVIPGLSGVNPKVSHFKNDMSKDLALEPRLFAAFMGIYLSEGYCTPENGENYGVFISQKNSECRKLIWDEILSQFPPDLDWHAEKDGFYLSDARLYRYLQPLGNTYTKHAPSEVKSLNPDCLKEFLFWFGIGDGRMASSAPKDAPSNWNTLGEEWRGSGQSFKSYHAAALRASTIPFARKEVFSVSPRLVQDLHECLVKSGGCGTLSTIVTEEDYTFAGRTIKAENKKPLYQLHIANSQNIWLDPRFIKIEQKHHTGNIFCLSVTHGNFYMEQNGKSFWTGNSDGRTQFQRVSHRITSISMESDGRIMGEIEIIPTSRGRDLVAIVESGGAVGVSSRGTGTTHKREDGSDIVNEDYTLITYDVVADPAHAGAYPEVFFESREVKNLGRVNMAESAKSLDALIASNPELATQLQSYMEQEVSKVRETLRAEESEKLKEEFDKRLLLQLEAIKKEEGEDKDKEDKDKEDKEKETAAAPVSEPAPETPAPAPTEGDDDKETELSKEKEKVAQLEKKLAEAEETAVQIGMRAKKMALEHVLEKTSKRSSNPSLFMDMIKDKISEADDADAIKAKIADTEGIIKKIDANMGEKAKVVGDLAQKVKEAVEAEVGSLKTRIEELEQQTADLSKEKQIAVEAASKALEVGKRGYMEAMKAEVIESKAGGHPARAQFRKLLNEANLPDAKSIEKFVEELVRGSRDSKSLQEARTRVAKGHSELLNESGSDAKPSAARRDGDRIFGYSSAEMRKLAGIK